MKAAHSFPAQELARRSALFEYGDLARATDDVAFLRRLNTLVTIHHNTIVTIRPPKTLADAVSAKGAINRHAELLAFGEWMITEGAPGLDKRGGRPAQPRIVLQTLGAAIAELHMRDRKLRSSTGGKPSPAKTQLTTTALARRWQKMFSETAVASDISSRTRSLKRFLTAYLDHIAAGTRPAGR